MTWLRFTLTTNFSYNKYNTTYIYQIQPTTCVYTHRHSYIIEFTNRAISTFSFLFRKFFLLVPSFEAKYMLMHNIFFVVWKIKMIFLSFHVCMDMYKWMYFGFFSVFSFFLGWFFCVCGKLCSFMNNLLTFGFSLFSMWNHLSNGPVYTMLMLMIILLLLLLLLMSWFYILLTFTIYCTYVCILYKFQFALIKGYT